MKSLNYAKIDSLVCDNPNQVHEGGFQKFHKFYDHALQTGERGNPNEVTSI